MLFCTSSLSIFAVCYDLNWCVVIVFELLPNSNWINTIKFQYKFLIFVKIWALISKLVLCECQLSLEIKINIFFRLKNPWEVWVIIRLSLHCWIRFGLRYALMLGIHVSIPSSLSLFLNFLWPLNSLSLI